MSHFARTSNVLVGNQEPPSRGFRGGFNCDIVCLFIFAKARLHAQSAAEVDFMAERVAMLIGFKVSFLAETR